MKIAAPIAPVAIEMVEVGPRDGLQNEKVLVSTADKLALIDRAIAAGSRRIEVASFVNPKKVPQMADAADVCAGLPDRAPDGAGMTYIGLVLNQRGAERAIATGRIDQLGAVCCASNAFGIANQGQSSAESVAVAAAVVAMAQAAGRTGQVTITTAFGCPFEGAISEDHVVAIAAQLARCHPVEIALADTIGVADPAQVARLVTRVRDATRSDDAPDGLPVRVHFHNTRGTGLANVWAAIMAGAQIVDSSLGGLGGCPFAPGAAGNVATEDVAYMLERAGVTTGLDLARLIAASQWLGGVMGKPMPSMVGKAGGFPQPAISSAI